MRKIHQFVASFRDGDAISNESRVIQRLLRTWGFESEIFAETHSLPPGSRIKIFSLAETSLIAPQDVVLLHLSTGSKVNTLFKKMKCRKAVLYHNITPPEFFRGLNEQAAMAMERGLEQMKQLAGIAEVVMADSRFNADELEKMGYHDVSVLPLILDFDAITATPDRKVLKRFDDGKINLLFVGRCAPNKRLEDALSCFYYLRNYVEPQSRFIHVGSSAGMEQYHALLMTFVRNLALTGVEMLGQVSREELMACYRSATVFISMSEHEGFCIPLIEAMAHDLPIVAYDAGAVVDTLNGAGVVCAEKNFDELAELIGMLAIDDDMRQSVIDGQRRRLADYRERDLETELKIHLAPLLE